MFSPASYYALWRNLEKDLTNHIRVFEPLNDSDEKDRVAPEVDRYGSASSLEWKAINSSERENNAESGARLIRRGRRIAWFSIPAWGVGDPGFKSQRPHHTT